MLIKIGHDFKPNNHKLRKRRYLKIQDCFEFLCPERWSNLGKTDQKGVKHCTVCNRNVHKATDKTELLQFGKEGKCAAYFESEMVLLGIIDPSIEMKEHESSLKGLTDIKSLKTKDSDQN